MSDSISPCIYPTCDDGAGNAALTTQSMCDRCRRRYRRELDWIVLDYVSIKAGMPSPVRRGTPTRHAAITSFGHPAEWASATCRDIALLLNQIEDEIRAELRADPALYVCPETVQVASAYRYLTDRFDLLCDYPNAAASAAAIHDTHNQIRSDLGLTKFAQKLPTPCPSCDVAALTRFVGQITCGNCDRLIREDQYPFFARIIIDDLIDAYDARETEKLA